MKDLTGQRFGKLTVLGFDGKIRGKSSTYYYWKCRCDCGEECVVCSTALTSGNTRSCGCIRKEVASKNGGNNATKRARKILYDGELHTVSEWSKIRGIPVNTIRKRLKNGHNISDVLSRNKLEAGGLREIPREKQKKITVYGTEYTIREAADKFGLKYSVIYSRLKRGSSPEKAVAKICVDK